MNKISNTFLSVFLACMTFFLTYKQASAQVTYQTSHDSRTEYRDDAGLRGDAGAKSGFYETPNPINFPVGGTTTNNWWHLLDIRHHNPANNYAMQFAGSFYNQELFFRKTNDNPATPWRKVVTGGYGTLGTGVGNQLELLSVNASTVGNGSFLKVLLKRHTSGDGWEKASTRLQAVTDVSDQGYIDFNPQGAPHGLAFGVNNIEFLKILANGNIGIGAYSPWAKMDIRTPGVNGADQYALNVQNPSTESWATVSINLSSGNDQSHSMISAQRNALGSGSSLFFQTSNSTGTIAPKMKIDPDGNVSIGTVESFNYKLAVNGSAIFTRAVVKQFGNWPDYVFEPLYKLPTLQEVEQFIMQHKHLPGVPSAKEVETTGLDLGENQAVLLKKIEELTLYILQQQKEIEALKQKVEKIEQVKS